MWFLTSEDDNKGIGLEVDIFQKIKEFLRLRDDQSVTDNIDEL